jgi:hypothetical protein
MQSPLNLTRAQLATLQGMQRDEPVQHESVEIGPAGNWQRKVPLRQNDCILLTLSRAKSRRMMELDQHQASSR